MGRVGDGSGRLKKSTLFSIYTDKLKKTYIICMEEILIGNEWMKEKNRFRMRKKAKNITYQV